MLKSKRKQDKIPKKVKKARSGKYKFSVRSHPTQGVISFCFGVLSLIIFVAVCLVSGNAKGTSGIAVGAVGMITFFVNIAGIIFAILALRKKEIHYRFPVGGAILNSILAIVFFATYIAGLL